MPRGANPVTPEVTVWFIRFEINGYGYTLLDSLDECLNYVARVVIRVGGISGASYCRIIELTPSR